MKPKVSLSTKNSAKIESVSIDGVVRDFEMISVPDIVHRLGRGVRHAGDDRATAFRIPGLVTTLKWTLLGCYDVRYNSSKDLQEHIDIGLSRSKDGGRTWEKMRIPISFGEHAGMPMAQNGVGDPSILVDTKTGTIWIVAAWTFGMGNNMAWWNSTPGMYKEKTAQLILSRSDDDGKTWSSPNKYYRTG